jgi:uncharacterized protein
VARRRVGTAAAVGLVASLLSACSAAVSAPSDPTTSSEATAAPSPGSRSSDATAAPSPGNRSSTPASASGRSGSDRKSAPGQARLNRELIDAAWKNDVKAARTLIKAGADVNGKDASEQSAFLIAASEGYLELLELSLDSGADVDSLDSYRGTALIRAAERGHADIVGRLLQSKIEVDHVNRLGWTALHEAIWLGKETTSYADTVRLLVAGGADIGLTAQADGRTPLDMARERGFGQVETTIRRSSKAATRAENSELLTASRSGDADGAAIAIRGGADVEARDARRRTPLLLAATFDRTAVARLLVPLGADPDALDDRHDSPWLVTGVTGSVAMAKILLAADPDLTLRNRFGGISIIPAAERGHVDYVRLMTKTSTNVNHVNDLGWTALLEAVILGDGSRPYVQIVTTLLDAGADPMLADRSGITALEHAERRGYSKIAAALRQ